MLISKLNFDDISSRTPQNSDCTNLHLLTRIEIHFVKVIRMLESEDFSFSSKDTFEEKRKFPLQPSGKKRKLNEEERLKRW
jgi:hypothetical protein